MLLENIFCLILLTFISSPRLFFNYVKTLTDEFFNKALNSAEGLDTTITIVF
jgi:hypothetical protein